MNTLMRMGIITGRSKTRQKGKRWMIVRGKLLGNRKEEAEGSGECGWLFSQNDTSVPCVEKKEYGQSWCPYHMQMLARGRKGW